MKKLLIFGVLMCTTITATSEDSGLYATQTTNVTAANSPVTLSTPLYGTSHSHNIVVSSQVPQNITRKSAVICNNSPSAQLEWAAKMAEDIFAAEMEAMQIVLPDPITAVVEFGDPTDFHDSDELCIVHTNYTTEIPDYHQYYPHIGGNPAFTHCLYPLALYSLGQQSNFSGNEPCMTISLYPDKDYYYGQNPENIAEDQYDMVTIILRGLVTGCGFQSSLQVHADGNITIGKDDNGNKYFTVFDANLRSFTYPITECVWNDSQLRNFLSAHIYGPNMIELHNDLIDCPDCKPSASTLNTIHYNETLKETTSDIELLEPLLYQGTVVRSITPRTKKVLNGLGWMYDAAPANENLNPCNINGSTLLRANTTYTYNATGGSGAINAMTCNLFATDSTYTLNAGNSNTLQVSFNALPDNNWERNPTNNHIMGIVKAEEETLAGNHKWRNVSVLPIEIPYKPNKPVCNIRETITDSILKIDIDAFAGGSDKYIVIVTPIQPGPTQSDTVTADILHYTIDNLSASKMYAIAIAGVNNEGKSTEVHQLVGHTSYPLTLHIETSINDISYYFTEHGEYATELTITSVTITDMNGVVVKTCNAAQNEKISIADLTPGTLYILNVTLDDGRTFSKQFMKK